MAQINDESNKRAYLAELLNDASIDCVLAVDNEQRVISWNTMCEVLSGKPKGSVMGKRLSEVFPALQASKALMGAMTHALAGFKSFVPADKSKVSEHYLESHFIPLKDVLGAVTGVLIIRHDVAHRVKAEEELIRLNAELARKNVELEQRNVELRSFAKVTSHGLKEPLRKIQVFIDMLLSREAERLSDDGRSYFSRIQSSVHKAETLTDDIFAFSNIYKPAEEATEVALGHVLKFAENHFREQIARKGAVVEGSNLPILPGHRVLLYQLFQHLLDNALKFCAEDRAPHINVSAAIIDSQMLPYKNKQPDLKYAAITIADNGIGFDPQDRHAVFELFTKFHPEGAYPGNGIGLPLCRKIMEVHEGFIAADSTPGEGSSFTCYFPQAQYTPLPKAAAAL